MSSGKRIARQDTERLEALRTQISLLKTFYTKAYIEHDHAYFGEIAAKLRLLVYTSRSNVPLLLNLMDKLKVEVTIVLDGPPMKRVGSEPISGDKLSLREFLNLRAYEGITSSGERVKLTKLDLLSKWAQQLGGAHQDQAYDEALQEIHSPSIAINGTPAMALELAATTRTVIYVADKFLETVSSRYLNQ